MELTAWTTAEWDEMRGKLEALSLDELRLLATRVGIHFSGGNESVRDSRTMTAKAEFLNVLDESDPAELNQEYERMIRSRERGDAPHSKKQLT